MAVRRKPNIVVIGGGTGAFTVLSGLRDYPAHLTAVVTMADDGGSAGVLREEFGILPPGDVRRVLIALSHSDNKLLSELFNYRFLEGGLSGHAFGNIMLTALERVTGNFEKAIAEASKILGVSGEVLPVTFDQVRLRAELEDGTVIHGETNIDVPKHDGALKIKHVSLDKKATANPRVLKAIHDADLIVIGPGDLYTSIIPNLLVDGIVNAMRAAQGTKAYIVNIMTKWGETNNFTAADFIREIEQYIGTDVLDIALVHNRRPTPARLARYAEEHARFVTLGDVSVSPRIVSDNLLRRHGFVRHDPDRLADALWKLVRGKTR